MDEKQYAEAVEAAGNPHCLTAEATEIMDQAGWSYRWPEIDSDGGLTGRIFDSDGPVGESDPTRPWDFLIVDVPADGTITADGSDFALVWSEAEKLGLWPDEERAEV